MAVTDHRRQPKKTTPLTFFLLLSLSLSLLSIASLILAFSLFKISSTKASPSTKKKVPDVVCDYLDGKWIYDSTVRSARYDHTCKEVYKGWNCIAGNKSNAHEIVKWRWKPHHCDLPQFDPIRFLQSYRDTNIGGRPTAMVVCSNLLVIKKVIGLMLMFHKERGEEL